MKTKLVRPVLVETKNKSRICHLSQKGKKFNDLRFLDVEAPIILDSINYQLILISLDPDENIEKYEKYYNTRLSKVFEAIANDGYPSKEDFKVIAIQDQLSPELINQLVAEYNNGGMRDFEIEITNEPQTDSDMKELLAGKLYLNKPKLTNCFVTVVKKHVSNVLNDPDFESKKSIYFPFKVNEDSIVLHGAGKFSETSLVLDRDKSLLLFIELWKFLKMGKNLSTETNSDAFDRGFIAGENSVSERLEAVLYSEEEVKTLINKAIFDTVGNPMLITSALKINDNWFNENKKK